MMVLDDLTVSENDGGIDSFYISFGDLMVILCVFFVMLLTMSKIETGSFAAREPSVPVQRRRLRGPRRVGPHDDDRGVHPPVVRLRGWRRLRLPHQACPRCGPREAGNAGLRRRCLAAGDCVRVGRPSRPLKSILSPSVAS